jgi:hypothetical protein
MWRRLTGWGFSIESGRSGVGLGVHAGSWGSAAWPAVAPELQEVVGGGDELPFGLARG